MWEFILTEALQEPRKAFPVLKKNSPRTPKNVLRGKGDIAESMAHMPQSRALSISSLEAQI